MKNTSASKEYSAATGGIKPHNVKGMHEISFNNKRHLQINKISSPHGDF
jgi:hypothetical protein